MPFAVTGLGLAGPLYTKRNRSAKSYILLLTCATTRALHLELSSDMSVDKFLMALDRFVSHRGLPHTVYSDNATTFQAARRELAEICTILIDPQTPHYFAHRGITLKFIAPQAAWWEGWWERMIGTNKRCIRKVLGKRQVDDEKLNKILASIEAAINSPPPDTGLWSRNIDISSLSSRRPAKHYPDRTRADLDQKSDKGIPTPTAGLLEAMDKGEPVGTSLLPPCLTTLWKEGAISRWRLCSPA